MFENACHFHFDIGIKWLIMHLFLKQQSVRGVQIWIHGDTGTDIVITSHIIPEKPGKRQTLPAVAFELLNFCGLTRKMIWYDY